MASSLFPSGLKDLFFALYNTIAAAYHINYKRYRDIEIMINWKRNASILIFDIFVVIPTTSGRSRPEDSPHSGYEYSVA